MLVNVAKQKIKISNINKVFWPQEKIYKGDLIEFYLELAEYILPHLINRPFVMKRYPDGIQGKFFYQKQCPAHAPKWISTVNIEKRQMILCNDADTLIWLINLGCIELHHWLAKLPHLENPDIIVFDLDPEPPAKFADTLKVALIIKEILSTVNISCYPKTSGSEGLHIYVPIEPKYSFEVIRKTLKYLCNLLVAQYPKLVTTELNKAKRKGKVYLDYLQNGYGKTMASVYSVRPVPGALVSTPLTWTEIKEGVDFRTFNIFNIKTRIRKMGDIFYPVNQSYQDFSPLVKTLCWNKQEK
ncbi:MAG: bifunctional non-ous end joining protein LigD [Clostridia bacterium]|jgi:bifunctional non-homologous end joining protein LigD|nr:bifunctional non-ous end joining protein LigD [Clostridia bacterium]MDN5322916.1 bifunctional non-ous end joining protein LigD [Clostridia bacterium]